ncbi:hypothetical protein [Pseudomonas moorei]|jgi:hypothetical protein|uniref:hypothetical protein n=1 Tax=Pseudomonas moorei TaxID=395599 RepID=UPI00111438D8|nr:hypothetical protein [Pseudomonas moorei]KAB0504878.1 hypothetical protein F7R06_14310 [Pseudomonas moorei]
MAFSIRKVFKSCRLRREFVEYFFAEPDGLRKFAAKAKVEPPGGCAFQVSLDGIQAYDSPLFCAGCLLLSRLGQYTALEVSPGFQHLH